MTNLLSRSRKARRKAAFGLPLTLAVLFSASVVPTQAQTLIYQEGFNTDGETNAVPRYTSTGRDVFEVPRIQAEIAAPNNFDQKGPIYFAHNFEVSYVGNPTIPGRRMSWTWRTDPNGGAATEKLNQLFVSTVNWLTKGKANATIVVNPNAESIHELAEALQAAGHTVVDDDTTTYPDEQDVPGDLFIHGPGANNPSRFALRAEPVIVMNEPDYDDMLVGSIGTLATFDPGQVTIAAPGHPAAGGLTGSFTGFNSPAQPFGLVGNFQPPGATTLATVTRVVAPTVGNLIDLDAIIAGTKQHESGTSTVSDLDFSDGSAGNWGVENSIPGGYTGVWGLRVQGKLSVAAAGTYRFALGSDDGARLLIDTARNGLTAADMIVEDAGPHGHQIVYSDVTFAAAGDYDFEVRSYNSGGGGSLEVSVSTVTTPVPDDALDSGFWEVLSENGTGPVKLTAPANATGYIATGPNVNVEVPLAVLLNGPTDVPPGSFYDGGQFTGYEGAGFFAAAGLNKWAYPNGQGYRSVQLKPVNVAGKSNVKLTIALAATVVDMETSDYVQVLVYTNGVSGTPITLANFHGVQNAIQPWMADEKENFTRRLTKQFADFTYDIPAGATDLVVEVRVATTWWTEIAAFDNIRITEGGADGTPKITSITRNGNNVTITWINGGTLESSGALGGPATTWTSTNDSDGSFTEPAVGTKFYRVRK